MSARSRHYDIVLLGATGYTGNLTAEYIQTHVATDLRWAIAGRNSVRLSQIAKELRTLNPDRIQPEIEVVEIHPEQVQQLAQKTKILISTIGPYSQYGEPVVAACIESKTHYFDITGETPFTFDMMNKYGQSAKENGVILAPHSGVDSIPADILSYMCVRKIREIYGVGTKECVNVMYELGGGPSAGSLASALSIIETYSSEFASQALNPWALSPIPPPEQKVYSSTFVPWLFGWRNLKPFGIVSSLPQAECDIGIVHRSWGLYDQGEFYGKNFHFNEYAFVGSRLKAFMVTYAFFWIRFGLNYLPLFRWLVKKLLPTPGQGPSKHQFQKFRVKFRTIATADSDPEHKVVADLLYNGSPYYLTGVLVVQAALCLLAGGDTLAMRLKGMVTPATWGADLIDRIKEAGVQLDVAIVE